MARPSIQVPWLPWLATTQLPESLVLFLQPSMAAIIQMQNVRRCLATYIYDSVGDETKRKLINGFVIDEIEETPTGTKYLCICIAMAYRFSASFAILEPCKLLAMHREVTATVIDHG